MVYAIRILLLFALLVSLAGCYRTTVPGRLPHATGKLTSEHTYQVRRGDTLYSIGKRFGIDYRVLARRNRIDSSYAIYVGQELFLHRTAPRAEYMPIPSTQDSRKPAAKRPSSQPQTAILPPPASNGRKLLWPLSGKVTSRFGNRNGRAHDGIDIAAAEGTPVRAAGSGEVVYSDHRLAGYGKLIIIRHGHDLFTAYAHNQRNLVRKGAKVKAGDVIARVGQTGRATGPHLHFEVRRGSTPVDPAAYLPR